MKFHTNALKCTRTNQNEIHQPILIAAFSTAKLKENLLSSSEDIHK
jgi:hypothetical protein